MKKYKVLLSFKWQSNWTEPGQIMELHDCEAATLLQFGKVQQIDEDDE